MAERRRRKVKTDDDSERSFSESDAEGEDVNEAENSATETPEKSTLGKVAEDSEIGVKRTEPLPGCVDEEGGKGGIAETEEVEGDFSVKRSQ
ncbi:hypothetical protein CEXT_412861 [Caerostris extrusa]|uniref:Uncharacterized protein n=1 Tax=Caerostris extrusa TaxID=172846 RepID=A0AAV4N7W8_CAEEX|nr:hypothetical protein CEXT_412861 [Caerostris extrusa]